MFFLLLMNHLPVYHKIERIGEPVSISELFFGRLAIERLETST